MAQATLNAPQSGVIDSPTRVLWRVSQRNASCSSAQSQEDGVPFHATMEEELLAALFAADEALQEALTVHDDFQRIAEERRVDETSGHFVRTDRKVSYSFDCSDLIELTCTSATGKSERISCHT